VSVLNDATVLAFLPVSSDRRTALIFICGSGIAAPIYRDKPRFHGVHLSVRPDLDQRDGRHDCGGQAPARVEALGGDVI
jgi:hypothetical protein